MNKSSLELERKCLLAERERLSASQTKQSEKEDPKEDHSSIAEDNSELRDDMEQWVSDTFYSYFPGFNNEYQKQKQHRENRENSLKDNKLNNENRSDQSLHSKDTTSVYDMIKVRPGSTRYKLLQDLRHTNLSSEPIANREDLKDLERKNISARKKEYQQELIQQIEEKRRSIEILKEKEREQERVLTRRLQDQLETIKLEEQLEMERIKAMEMRFKAEQNRHMRNHILAKLENDSKLLEPDDLANFTNKKTDKENLQNSKGNNVYKYFSNSGKKPFQSPKDQFDEIDFHKIEKECFHLSEKICPICDRPLKELEPFCLRCHNRILYHSAILVDPKHAGNEDINANIQDDRNSNNGCEDLDTKKWENGKVFACVKCERIYAFCPQCWKKDDTCSACNTQKNLCMYCRTNLCSFCLGEVASGKNSENHHVNEKSDYITDSSFQIAANGETETSYLCVGTEIFSQNNLSGKCAEHSPNYLYGETSPSTQLNKQLVTTNNITGPEIIKINQKRLKNSPDDRQVLNNYNDKDIQKLRQKTDTTLMNYLRNYKDLTFYSNGRALETTANSRRNVLNGDSLAIPILCDMPKMVRKGKPKPNNLFSNLKQRWDIPAVQTITISATSPKVVTQVGAIRKQLQTENLFLDNRD
uniref:Uncharacterized protein n=2 Tax=Stomoxys calcitrans TaxID=35570 RepID=A0A1I8PL52_STOCA